MGGGLPGNCVGTHVLGQAQLLVLKGESREGEQVKTNLEWTMSRKVHPSYFIM